MARPSQPSETTVDGIAVYPDGRLLLLTMAAGISRVHLRTGRPAHVVVMLGPDVPDDLAIAKAASPLRLRHALQEARNCVLNRLEFGGDPDVPCAVHESRWPDRAGVRSEPNNLRASARKLGSAQVECRIGDLAYAEGGYQCSATYLSLHY